MGRVILIVEHILLVPLFSALVWLFAVWLFAQNIRYSSLLNCILEKIRLPELIFSHHFFRYFDLAGGKEMKKLRDDDVYKNVQNFYGLCPVDLRKWEGDVGGSDAF